MLLTGAAGATGTGHRSIEIVVADFDRPGFVNKFGEAFGAWDRDPRDPTQCCRIQLVDQPRIGDTGYSLRVDYDVDSPNPAYNGLWMKLPALALDELQNLRVAIRGDSTRGYTRRVKLELKDGRHSAVYVLDGIGPSWIRMRIPLQAFGDIERLHTVKELVIVFDDRTVTQPTGTLYLDEIVFERR